jgi:uncharacterized protein
MMALSILYGGLVGLSLGLTGGGGAIFAVPLLVYGLQTPAREAVGISLSAVGATSGVGFVHRWKLGEVEIRTGLLFAVAGMAGAPVGAWFAKFVPDAVLLLSFAVLMIIVVALLWRKASPASAAPLVDQVCAERQAGPTCRRNATGVLILTSRCAILLLASGVLTGMLSGLFGVGGGFVIVPALVLFSGMPIHLAVGTSLMVISLVSASGIAARIWSGLDISPSVTGLFVLGGVGGLFFGQRIGRRLSGPALQKVFAVAIVAVAVFVILRNWNP